MFFTFSYCGKCFFWVLWRSFLFVHEIISARGNSMHIIFARVSRFARSRDAGLRGVLVLNVPRLHWFSCVLPTCTVHCIRLLSACSFLLTPPPMFCSALHLRCFSGTPFLWEAAVRPPSRRRVGISISGLHQRSLRPRWPSRCLQIAQYGS